MAATHRSFDLEGGIIRRGAGIERVSAHVFAAKVYERFKAHRKADVLHSFCGSPDFQRAAQTCIGELLIDSFRVRDNINHEYGTYRKLDFLLSEAEIEKAYEVILKFVNKKQGRKTRAAIRATRNHNNSRTRLAVA